MGDGSRWFEQPPPEIRQAKAKEAPALPERPTKDNWLRCNGCAEFLYKPKLEENRQVCPHCDHHYRWSGLARLGELVDDDSFERHDADIAPTDALGFVDSKSYVGRIEASQKKVGELDAFVSGSATIDGMPVEIGTFQFAFMGGSMGSVVGEAITRLFERALKNRRPAIVISASGGARMQEGILSLMQMAKTCAALARLRASGMPYVSILTDPTTGGVAASFAMLGDLILAEPKALIGFAGPRVIEQTIGEALPEGFQTSEYLLEHGMLDFIVGRDALRERVAWSLRWMLEPA